MSRKTHLGSTKNTFYERSNMFGTRFTKVLILATALSLLLAPLALADSDVTGSFSIGNGDPSVTSVGLNNMDPQVPTSVTVDVTDVNTMGDVNKVEVTLYYSNSGSVDPTPPIVADTKVCAILTWERVASPEWSISAGSPTTWAVSEAASSAPSDSLTSGTWTFGFTPGKVATETAGSPKWFAYAKVTDSQSATGDGDSSGVLMSWRGEIDVTTASVTWTSVAPGSDFGANAQGSIGITYIANGAYDEKVSASGTWSTGSVTATLDEDGTCSGGNEFSLKANDEAVLATAAVFVKATGHSPYNPIDETGTLTGEAGDTVSANTLWLKLAAGFENGTYAGTITYIIENGS